MKLFNGPFFHFQVYLSDPVWPSLEFSFQTTENKSSFAYRCIFPNFDHFLQLRFVQLTTTYMCTLVFLINVLHVYLSWRNYSNQHGLIRNNMFIKFQGKFLPTLLFGTIIFRKFCKPIRF